MRLLLGPLIFILIVVIPSGGIDYTSMQSGPHLIVSSINGTLEIDRPGTIWFDIKNDANSSAVGQNASGQRFPAWLQPGYGTNVSDAMGVSAELLPKDAVFEILTGPQLAGSLKGGKNRTVEFNLRTDDTAVPGVYPVDLLVTYRRLSEVQTSGDPEQPDATFQYANVSETIPGEVNVVQGPRILVDEVKDSVLADKESELNLILKNGGDLPATDLRAKILSEAPFNSDDGSLLLGNLDPGHSASAKFRIKTENGTVPGVYALQIGADYLDDKTLRREELAGLVPVKSQSETWSMLSPVAGALVLISAAYVIARTYQGKFRRKRKRLW
ncbi:Uncharacterised protein [uncultured archaeon]|nr:Uncharacterised protein [uncultured archaeon]